MAQYISVGKFGKTHGVKGFIRVYSETGDVSVLASGSPWFQKTKLDFEPMDVDNIKLLPEYLLVHVRGIDTPEEAKRLTNQLIYINRKQLPALDKGKYYWDDLIGSQVVNLDSVVLGLVDEVMETGAHDVLVLKGEKRRLVPFVKDRVVKSVDLNRKLITVDWNPDF
jgi:16S rRNA processing protein RimM